MTDDERDELDVLLDAFDDIIPLWEAHWELRDRARGKRAIRSLLNKQWISIWRAQHWVNRAERELTGEELATLLPNLDDDIYWEPSADPNDGFYGYFATAVARAELERNEQMRHYYRDEWAPRARARGALVDK